MLQEYKNIKTFSGSNFAKQLRSYYHPINFQNVQFIC